MSAIKKILVPTDFSEASKAALRYACELATATNASLCILHAVENPYRLGGFPGPTVCLRTTPSSSSAPHAGSWKGSWKRSSRRMKRNGPG